jgi:hypothetical protein
MEIKVLSDKILLSDKKDVLRLYLYGKLLQKGIRPMENDMNVLLELYQFGGYHNKEQQQRFVEDCLKKGFKRSAQSVNNTLSLYTKKGVLQRPKNSVRTTNEQFLPLIDCDRLVLQSIISHQN